MKWVSLVITLILGAIAFKYFVYDTNHPGGTGPFGIAAIYVDAAVKGDQATIEGYVNRTLVKMS